MFDKMFNRMEAKCNKVYVRVPFKIMVHVQMYLDFYTSRRRNTVHESQGFIQCIGTSMLQDYVLLLPYTCIMSRIDS